MTVGFRRAVAPLREEDATASHRVHNLPSSDARDPSPDREDRPENRLPLPQLEPLAVDVLQAGWPTHSTDAVLTAPSWCRSLDASARIHAKPHDVQTTSRWQHNTGDQKPRADGRLDRVKSATDWSGSSRWSLGFIRLIEGERVSGPRGRCSSEDLLCLGGTDSDAPRRTRCAQQRLSSFFRQA